MLKKDKNYKQIFFDLDGTLLDTAPEFSRSINNLTLKRLNKEISFNEIRNLVSDGVGALVKLAFGVSENEEEFEIYRKELLNEYAKFYLDSSLFDEINKMLEEIEEKGIIWGVVTNKPKYLAEKIFEKFDWHKRTEILICPQDVFDKRKLSFIKNILWTDENFCPFMPIKFLKYFLGEVFWFISDHAPYNSFFFDFF